MLGRGKMVTQYVSVNTCALTNHSPDLHKSSSLPPTCLIAHFTTKKSQSMHHPKCLSSLSRFNQFCRWTTHNPVTENYVYLNHITLLCIIHIPSAIKYHIYINMAGLIQHALSNIYNRRCRRVVHDIQLRHNATVCIQNNKQHVHQC